MGHWDLSKPLGVIIFAVIIFLLSCFFFYKQIKGSSQAKNILYLEAFRLLIIFMIIFTLLKPEWVEEKERTEIPVVVFLKDVSSSMETLDTIDGDNQNIITRKEWLEKNLTEEFLKPLHSKYKVKILPFSIGTYDDKGVLKNSNISGFEDGTNIAGALKDIKLKYESSLRTVVLLSDGDWNIGGSPYGIAFKLRNQSIPVFTVGIGSTHQLPDVSIEDVNPPSFAFQNNTTPLPFRVKNTLSRDVTCKVTLTSQKGEAANPKEITIPQGKEISEAIQWKPTEQGKYTLTIEIPAQKGEKILSNNKKTFDIIVKNETLYVLIVDSRPRYEYRYIRNALIRDAHIEVQTVLFHDQGMKMGYGEGYLKRFPNLEELTKYDVIFLGDVGRIPGQLTDEDIKNLKNVVEKHASGLVFIPGIKGYQHTLINTPLYEILPVHYEKTGNLGKWHPSASHLRLTHGGKNHWLLKLDDNEFVNARIWQKEFAFYWWADAVKHKTNAEVLAHHSAEKTEDGRRVPVMVIRESGHGQTLYLGTNGVWRLRRGVEDLYHMNFWHQVASWMAYTRHQSDGNKLTGITLFWSPGVPRKGEQVALHAILKNNAGLPIRGATVICELISPSNKIQEFELKGDKGNEMGVYDGFWTPIESGSYQIKVSAKKEGLDEIIETIRVGKKSLEKIGQRAKHNSLNEIAKLTKAKFFRYSEFAKIHQVINQLPRQVIEERRVQLWSSWWWGSIIVFLLTVYWSTRKLMGLI